MSKPGHSSELLDIPDRKQKIAKLLADQDTQEKPTRQTEIPKPPPPEQRKTFKIEPSSDLLSRVQAFLPQLQSANEKLSTVDPAKLDIENVEDEEQPYIEMNLGLGVFEEKRNDSSSESEDEDDILILPNREPSTANGKKPIIQLLPDDDTKE